MDGFEFLTTEQVLDRLATRFDGLIFIGYTDRSDVQYGVSTFFQGGAPLALGLMEIGKDFLMKDVKKRNGGRDE